MKLLWDVPTRDLLHLVERKRDREKGRKKMKETHTQRERNSR